MQKHDYCIGNLNSQPCWHLVPQSEPVTL